MTLPNAYKAPALGLPARHKVLEILSIALGRATSNEQRADGLVFDTESAGYIQIHTEDLGIGFEKAAAYRLEAFGKPNGCSQCSAACLTKA